MKIGLSYDLKETVSVHPEDAEDALEEYDAPETIQAISSALASMGHSVIRLGGGREFLANILQHRDLDFVFNIAEGRGTFRSREAQIPSVLEMLGIPYTGADPQCLAICLDKPLTKTLLRTARIRTPKWRVVTGSENKPPVWDGFPLPAFVKPAYEGSSKGVRLDCRADSPDGIDRLVARMLEQYCQSVIVEEFIAGDEVTVGVVGFPPQVIGIMRIRPRKGSNPQFVYSLEVKRDWENLVSYECPAQLPAPTLREISRFALKCFDVLGCRDLARIDFRVDTRGKAYLLEINPLAGLRPGYSDLPIMAEKIGYDYNSLIGLIVKAFQERQKSCQRKSA